MFRSPLTEIWQVTRFYASAVKSAVVVVLGVAALIGTGSAVIWVLYKLSSVFVANAGVRPVNHRATTVLLVLAVPCVAAVLTELGKDTEYYEQHELTRKQLKYGFVAITVLLYAVVGGIGVAAGAEQTPHTDPTAQFTKAGSDVVYSTGEVQMFYGVVSDGTVDITVEVLQGGNGIEIARGMGQSREGMTAEYRQTPSDFHSFAVRGMEASATIKVTVDFAPYQLRPDTETYRVTLPYSASK